MLETRKLYQIICLVLFPVLLLAQQYGKNKVQYDHLDWKYIQSKHFDIYYYQGGYELAEFAAVVAESSFTSLKKSFNYDLTARIPLIIYKSHNDFSETNTSPQIVGESVGGFTEFLKNRVVLPFQGSYEKFRHVIHHELTHAVMLQFMYGSGPGSIIRGVTKMSPPIWFIEGLAEFESIGWDTESDMFARDATLKGYLPPIQNLSGYLAYKGGQAVWLYIEETFGGLKRTELLHRIQSTRDFSKAWKLAFNEPLEKTTEKWHAFMQKKYWPEISHRKRVTEYAQKITDHVKWKNFVNNSPALSPSGDRIAFLSDKSGYFDIYVMDTLDPEQIERIVKGQRKSNLEELNWLQPGISWSPDGRKIAFAARSEGEDAIHIISVKEKKILQTYKFGLDALFSPMWSPVANNIAFVGMKDGRSDIYIFNIDLNKVVNITDDIFTDMEPAWSPNGAKLAFVSYRHNVVEPHSFRGESSIMSAEFSTSDIYTVYADGSGLERITDSNYNEKSPQWLPSVKELVFVSDRNGINNIYKKNLESGEIEPLTNLIGGGNQLSWSLKSNRLAFTSFSDGGYDVYLWTDPLSTSDKKVDLKSTKFAQNSAYSRQPYFSKKSNSQLDKVVKEAESQTDFSDYVFDDDFINGRIGDQKNPDKVVLDENQIKTDEKYKSRDYSLDFGIDNINANAGYDPIFGLQGLTQLSISDLLGDRKINIGANLNKSISNADFFLQYVDLKHRFDWSIDAYQYVYLFATNFGTARFANRGASAAISYPFSRYKRMDVDFSYFYIIQENLTFTGFPTYKAQILSPSISYVRDNSIPGFTAPHDGDRDYINISGSPKVGSDGKEFFTTKIDFRRYLSIGRLYSIALRLTGGASFGQNKTLFILGGMNNWLNRRFTRNLNVVGIQDYYLSELMTPLRGANYYELIGNKAALFNIEFRYPLVDYFVTHFPLKLVFQNIRGNIFIDAGSAWTNNADWKFIDKNENGNKYVKDVTTGFGWGVRANVYLFLLKFDTAWSTDFNSTSAPKFYWSIGMDF